MADVDYRELVVFQKARALAFECYQLTRSWPREADAVRLDLCRTSLAIGGKIAQGHDAVNITQRDRAFDTARGKLARLDALLFIAVRLRHATAEQVDAAHMLLEEVSRLLTVLERAWHD